MWLALFLRPFPYTLTMRRLVTLLLLGALVVLMTGCYKSVFDANEPRTQFETYDRLRNRYTPLEETDVFGNKRPALRARLQNRD